MPLDDRLRRIGGAARQFVFDVIGAPPATAAAARPQPSGARRALLRRLARGSWLLAGFAATLAVLWVGAARLYAELSRYEAPSAALVGEHAQGDAFMAALIHLHSLRARSATLKDDRAMFATTALRRREAYFLAGAETAASAALNEVPAARGARSVELADARALATSTALDDRAKLAGALMRLQSAIADGRVTFDRSDDALRALCAAAVADLELRAEALAAETGAGDTTERAEAGFYSARGAAYGWAAALRGAAQDTEDAAMADGLGPALAALDRAASASPLFLSNGNPMGDGPPNHLSALALELELAKDGIARAASLPPARLPPAPT
ncbi:MAG: hypothetical protein GC189_11010 [Alphaproteobacteria bacterium]|nr:hypothetical protein [Alphaproteobacteria bacterium]